LVKAVFLDIDGTLMDTNYLHIEAWAQAFEEVGDGRRARGSTTRWARAPTS
jgi:beta-phosphoglucomutase-like phosphatase (HAD superfamily)